MNQASEPMREESANPWRRQEELPIPERRSVILSAALFLVASAALALSFWNEYVAIVAWGLLIAGGFFLTRRFRRITLTVILLSVLGALLPGGLLPLEGLYYPTAGAVVAAACVGCGAGAYFQTVTKNFWALPLLALALSGGSYFLTGEWLYAVMGVALIPAALLISLSTRRGDPCVTVICCGVGGLLLSLLGILALWIWREQGSVGPSVIRSFLEGWKEHFAQVQIASREELLATVDQSLAESGISESTAASLRSIRETLAKSMSDGVIRESIDTLFQMLPALLFLCCAIPAYGAQRWLNAAYATNGMGEVITPESEFFTVSLPSAALFLLSFLIMSVGGASFVAMVAGNLCLGLLPCMCLVGLRYLRFRFRGNRLLSRRGGFLLLLPLFCCASSGILYLLGFYGACERIAQAAQRQIKKKMRENGNDPSDFM